MANVYLHYVLDKWFHNDVVPCMRARAQLVRYADDAVMIFEVESDARRVLAVLGKPCSKFGLTIHPEKTRLVDFRRPMLSQGKSRNTPSKPETFDLLGFTYYWSRSRSGQRVVKRKTMSSRLTRSVQTIASWCTAHRHDRLVDQHAALCRKVRRHDAYYGITGTASRFRRFAFWFIARGVAGSAAESASESWTGRNSIGCSKRSHFRHCASCIRSSDIARQRSDVRSRML